mmetsp:Transcript_15668/g.24380  ORF Transcript_15668/g.24380 Transcript_15668/m.24380 type:complete len:225 (+) Transcript_15668:91-765(+)
MFKYAFHALLMPLAAQCMPMFFVTKPNFCSTSVEIAGDTLLNINWEAPEMDEDGKTNGQAYSLSITPSGGSRGRNRRKSKGSDRQITVLKANKKGVGKGQILYTSPEDGGKLDICVLNRGASQRAPVMFGFNVIVGHDKSYYEEEALDKHLSRLQVNIMKMKDEIEDIIREADYMKNVEKGFHEHSLSMHAASHWWPMIQTLVLLLTGATTIMHMISFFNKRVF